jgi:hypothetical protein
LGLKGEDTALVILRRLLPPGYSVERNAPNILSEGNCDFIIKDSQGRVILLVEVKNWDQYSVSHETVVNQVLSRANVDADAKLLITSNAYLAARCELKDNSWQVAFTKAQISTSLTPKESITLYLAWKTAMAKALDKLGLYHDPFRREKKPTSMRRSQGVFSFLPNIPVIVNEPNQIRFSIVDAFVHCISLDVFT